MRVRGTCDCTTSLKTEACVPMGFAEQFLARAACIVSQEWQKRVFFKAVY